jgi:ribonuclease III
MKRGGQAALETVESRIGYAFDDHSLLKTALTHASTAGGSNYQRFEFLGDRVLGLVIAEMLLEAFPKAQEGELSRRLADLVCKETCAAVAAELDLGEAIRLGGGKAQRADMLTTNLLGDVCEAVIGAVFLDGDFDAAARFIEENWRERMLTSPGESRNAKATLQEWAQGKGLPAPKYSIVERSGPDHRPKFAVEVQVASTALARGEGLTRREAEQEAASVVLVREGVWRAER